MIFDSLDYNRLFQLEEDDEEKSNFAIAKINIQYAAWKMEQAYCSLDGDMQPLELLSILIRAEIASSINAIRSVFDRLMYFLAHETGIPRKDSMVGKRDIKFPVCYSHQSFDNWERNNKDYYSNYSGFIDVLRELQPIGITDEILRSESIPVLKLFIFILSKMDNYNKHHDLFENCGVLLILPSTESTCNISELKIQYVFDDFFRFNSFIEMSGIKLIETLKGRGQVEGHHQKIGDYPFEIVTPDRHGELLYSPYRWYPEPLHKWPDFMLDDDEDFMLDDDEDFMLDDEDLEISDRENRDSNEHDISAH